MACSFFKVIPTTILSLNTFLSTKEAVIQINLMIINLFYGNFAKNKIQRRECVNVDKGLVEANYN